MHEECNKDSALLSGQIIQLSGSAIGSFVYTAITLSRVDDACPVFNNKSRGLGLISRVDFWLRFLSRMIRAIRNLRINPRSFCRRFTTLQTAKPCRRRRNELSAAAYGETIGDRGRASGQQPARCLIASCIKHSGVCWRYSLLVRGTACSVRRAQCREGVEKASYCGTEVGNKAREDERFLPLRRDDQRVLLAFEPQHAEEQLGCRRAPDLAHQLGNLTRRLQAVLRIYSGRRRGGKEHVQRCLTECLKQPIEPQPCRPPTQGALTSTRPGGTRPRSMALR
jgi:hypothetical protein